MSLGLSKVDFPVHGVEDLDLQRGWIHDIRATCRNTAWRCLQAAISDEVDDPIPHPRHLTEQELEQQRRMVREYMQQQFALNRGYSLEGLWREIEGISDEYAKDILQQHQGKKVEIQPEFLIALIHEFLHRSRNTSENVFQGE